MAIFEIPMKSVNQTVAVALSGIGYQMTLRWRDAFQNSWVLDIADAAGNALINGIPLSTGHDMLEQYKYIGIPGKLVCQTDGDPNQPPTFENFGTNSHLYYIT